MPKPIIAVELDGRKVILNWFEFPMLVDKWRACNMTISFEEAVRRSKARISRV